MKKRIFLCIAAATLSIVSAAPVMAAGWSQSGNNWVYVNDNGTIFKGWGHTSDGWYYLEPTTGIMVTGWHKIDGAWYYFAPTGLMVTGWLQHQNKWYYMMESGEMAVNAWIGNYYVGIDGVMMTNAWIGQYYVGTDGAWIPNYGVNTAESTAIQHIREVYKKTNERKDLTAYESENYTDYMSGTKLVKAVLRNDRYVPFTTTEYYYDNDRSLIFCYGVNTNGEYRYYYNARGLIREIGPDGVVKDYPDGDGFSKTSDSKAQDIYNRGVWEAALCAEDY